MNPLTSNSMNFMLFSKICEKRVIFIFHKATAFVFFRVLGPYSLDVMTSASFSIESDSINNPDDPLVAHLKKITNFKLLPFLVACVYSGVYFTRNIDIIQQPEIVNQQKRKKE